MPGKAAKVLLSEKPWGVLQEMSRSRTEPKCVVQRAVIMLLVFEGRQEVATKVTLHPQQVGTWRQRWRDSSESLCVWECREPRRLRGAILEVLADAPRSGSPGRTGRRASRSNRRVGARRTEAVGATDHALDAGRTPRRDPPAEDCADDFSRADPRLAN